MLVTMAPGKGDVPGDELAAAIKDFLENLRPSIAAAEEVGGVIAIENHSNSLLRTPDSVRRFADAVTSDRVGVALAPHHLPQDAHLIATLARDLGPRMKFVYAQQDGKGSKEKLPKEVELLQMPGRGPLDFGPLMRELAAQRFAGPVEIFMHPVPRGVPILDTVPAITAECTGLGRISRPFCKIRCLAPNLGNLSERPGYSLPAATAAGSTLITAGGDAWPPSAMARR